MTWKMYQRFLKKYFENTNMIHSLIFLNTKSYQTFSWRFMWQWRRNNDVEKSALHLSRKHFNKMYIIIFQHSDVSYQINAALVNIRDLFPKKSQHIKHCLFAWLEIRHELFMKHLCVNGMCGLKHARYFKVSGSISESASTCKLQQMLNVIKLWECFTTFKYSKYYIFLNCFMKILIILRKVRLEKGIINECSFTFICIKYALRTEIFLMHICKISGLQNN